MGWARPGKVPPTSAFGRPWAAKSRCSRFTILDFDEDVYGRLLTVTLRRKIREERWFPSLDALRIEIERDIEKTRAFFAQDTATVG